MPDLNDLINDLKAVPEKVQAGIDQAMNEDGHEIAEINREQLESGLNYDGDFLGNYAESTKKIRRKKGLQTDHIDLKFTGKFHREIKVEPAGKNTFELTSTDPKWENKLHTQKRFEKAIGIMSNSEDRVTEVVTSNIEAKLDEILT